jgi:DNA helicase-2/ATP-dependent DNA helicase PcrA
MPLNRAQTKAVTTPGIQLIIAGPGSGKTRVITEKILHLLDNGVPPGQILALTFSDKAATEMEDRIEKNQPHLDLAIHTFHSFCLEVLDDNVLESGISRSRGIISRSNQLIWGLRNIDAFGFEHVKVGNNAAEIIEAMIDGISTFRDELITPDMLEAYLTKKESATLDEEEETYLGLMSDLLKVYRGYEEYKRSENFIDFDDMIHYVVNLFTENDRILSAYRKRYQYILVDEFQDTNFAQLELIKALAGEHLCVVGDDDQTIYRFRGAYLTNIPDFKQCYSNHTVTLLNENYRNTKNILDLALHLMTNAPSREEKALVTKKDKGHTVTVATCGNEDGEGEYVAQEIAKLVGTPFFDQQIEKERAFEYRDFAILCRSRRDGLKFDRALRRHSIPCEFKGDVDFLRLPVIRDMMAYLRTIDNPLTAGLYLNRIMKVCSVPEIIVQSINAHAAKRVYESEIANDGVFETMLEAGAVVPGHAEQIAGILRMLEHFVEGKEEHTLTGLVYEVMMQASGLYRSALADNAVRTRLYLTKFYEISQEYDQLTRNATLGDFLEYLGYLSAFSVDIEERELSNTVQILTAHKSKGKEFPVVFVVDLSQRRFPLNYKSKKFHVPADLARGLRTGEDEKALFLQEERRLLYVAMTRAEERLYLICSKWYGSNKRESKPSVFLTELSYTDNPLIDAVDLPAYGTDIPVEETTPYEETRASLQIQAVRAISEMRLSTALQNLVTLERLREYAERGTTIFDRDEFFGLADTKQPVEEILKPVKVPLVKEKMEFSASALKLYKDCPLQYKFSYILKTPRPPQVAPQLTFGSCIHSVIEQITTESGSAEAQKAKALSLLDSLWQPESYENRTQGQEYRASADELIDTYLSWQGNNPNTVAEIEKEFRFPFAGRTMHGFIDRVERTPEGKYVVIDFKSGKKPGDITKKSLPENIQLNMYALAVQALYGELPERTTLFFIRDNKIVDYLPTESSIAAFSVILEEMVKGITSEQFPPLPDFQICKWCPYGDLCEVKEIDES